ncbi:MAG: NAD-glutamate dehydrogenase domain-containing protein, partial [Pseudomonadales bacterium]
GTYVKASVESDEDVGDRSNDAVRVSGKDIQAQVIGEGGNLGATQLGRIEFARAGGAINTDFIDNAGGVDCSDHEVNIKILLDKLVSCKKLGVKQRNQILVAMTDQVAELVLMNNYRQVQAISIAEFSARQSTNDYRRFINDFVKRGKLNRELEYLPDEKELKGRINAGQGLTRPELSVLISYAKADLKERMVDAPAISDSYVSRIAETAFPVYLQKRFAAEIDAHPLKKQIIATQLANEVVNMLGVTFIWRTQEFIGASLDNVVTAYVLARDVFELGKVWEAIEKLDNQVPASLQISALHELIEVTQDAIRWFLKKGTLNIDIAATVSHYRKGVRHLEKLFVGAKSASFHDLWKTKEQELIAQNVPADLATKIAARRVAYFALDLVAVEDATGIAIEKIFQIYILIDGALGLDAFREQIEKIESTSQWHQMAREAFHDELDAQTRALIASLVAQKEGKVLNCEVVVQKWLLNNKPALQRWRALQKEFLRSAEPDIALFSVAIRELSQLSQLSQSGLEAAELN